MDNTTSAGLIVTVTPKDESRNAFARFTWSADLEDCDMVAVGIEDAELDALLAAKAHEGVDLDGWTVELS